jgi:signal transduction histidine kinase
VPVYFLLLATGYLATHKTSYDLKQTIAIVMATVIVIAIYRFQTFAGYRIAITFYAASIGLLILFFALETPEFEKLQETLEKLEEAGKDAQIARRHAEEADRAKAEFLSQMSHEIKTPINSILGFDNLILEKIGNEEGDVKRYAENIREAGDRLLAFFNNLLEISKLGAESIGAR